MTVLSRQKKGRQQSAAGPSSLSDTLAAVQTAHIAALRRMWMAQIGGEPPAIRSTSLFRKLLAWELQAKSLGGLDSTTSRELGEIAATLDREGDYEPKLRRDFYPGVVLTREWKGVVHKVTVVKGGFQYQGTSYKSLSEIARRVTGTRWSGPRFFGLEQRVNSKQNGSAS